MEKKDFDIKDAVWSVISDLYGYPIGSYAVADVKMADDWHIKIEGKLVSLDGLTGQPCIMFTAKQWVYYKGMYECIAEYQLTREAWPDNFEEMKNVSASQIAIGLLNGLERANQERVKNLQMCNQLMLERYRNHNK